MTGITMPMGISGIYKGKVLIKINVPSGIFIYLINVEKIIVPERKVFKRFKHPVPNKYRSVGN